MELLVNGSSLPIAQLGTDFIILTRPLTHPPTHGEILLRVDESEQRWAVRLPEGISPNVKTVRITNK
jgi:hypothetical protein